MHSDLLITNATVLTMDRSSTVIDDAAIAIADGRIVAVGPRRGVIDVYGQATRVIDAHAAIVLPGFVNLHAHLAMTLLRGWADDLDLAGFLDRVFPVEEALVSPEMIRAGVTLAVAESLLAGTTTALDMYFYPEVASEIARSASFRLANGPVVFSFPGPDRMDYADRMVHAEAALAKARAAEELFSGRWLCPHSTYTIEPSHLEEVRDLAARHGAGIHIHAAETAAEVATVVGRTGRRPVELLGDLGMLGPATVLAHAVHLTDHEIGLIASSGASVAHNPLSNMKLASGFARVPDLLRAGVVTGIGTDGTASSNDLDHYVAMRFASTVHKAHVDDPTVVTAMQTLRMATIDGARALGVDAEIGSIEVGKRADLQVLRHDRPNLVPSFDPVSTVVYAAGRADVRTVVVGGRVVVDDGRCTSLDVDEVLAEARRFAEKVRACASRS